MCDSTPPALMSSTALPVIGAAPVLWPSSDMLHWLFESCIGIGSVKMGIAGLASQVLFLAPIDTMRRIVADKSVGKLPLLPYSAMFANGCIWTAYGVLQNNPAIWIPNTLGIVLGSLYSGVFLRYCPVGADWLPHTCYAHMVGVLGVGSVVAGAWLCFDHSMATQIVGIMGNIVCITMFAGPLSAIRTVMREKCTRSLPFSFTIATMVNCSLWAFYGTFLLNDPLIIVPNALGLLSSLIQLGLFVRFGFAR